MFLLIILMSEVVFVGLFDHGHDEDEEEGHQPAGAVDLRVYDVRQDQSDDEVHVGYPPLKKQTIFIWTLNLSCHILFQVASTMPLKCVMY